MKFVAVIVLAASALGVCRAQPVQDLKYWAERAQQIHVGMRREDVERILPPYVPPEGGYTAKTGFTSSSQGVTYTVAPGYTVIVFYDYTGIPRDADDQASQHYSPDNRVLEPVKIWPAAVSEQRQVIMAGLAKALAAKDATAITAVRLEIEAIPPRAYVEKSSRAVRDTKLRLWLATLQKVDATQDKSFDPNDRGFINIAPPAGRGGKQHTFISGMSPDDIKDPEVREEYKRMIAANAAKIERYSRRVVLYNARWDWIRTVEYFRRDQYDDSAEDTATIAQLVVAEIKDPALKKEVSALLMVKK